MSDPHRPDVLPTMDDARVMAVARLWKAHSDAPFPGRLTSVDVVGVETVTLDADVAGCVSTWLNNGGNIDAGRRDILAARKRGLERVVSELSDREAVYYQRLLDMTVLVLDSQQGPAPG